MLFKKNGVISVHGHGTIATPNQVIVKNNDGGRTTIHTNNIMIATGSEVTSFPGIEVYVPQYIIQFPGIEVYVPQYIIQFLGIEVYVPQYIIQFPGIEVYVPQYIIQFPGIEVYVPQYIIQFWRKNSC